MHLGSWRRVDGNRFLSCREMAQPLAKYVCELGLTHVGLMPASQRVVRRVREDRRTHAAVENPASQFTI